MLEYIQSNDYSEHKNESQKKACSMMILRILLVFPNSEHNLRMTQLPSNGQGGMPPSKGFFSLSGEWGGLLFQTKFLAVGTSLGHLSMKNFLDWIYCLVPKIRQGEGAEGVAINPTY